MRAKLKSVFSLDVPDLRSFVPADPAAFSLPLRLMVGPEDEAGDESFDVTVCTPKWLERNHSPEDIVMGRHLLLVFQYDLSRILARLDEECARCTGITWPEVAEKVGRIGYWEFEDYAGT